jgi:hypothetical protein
VVAYRIVLVFAAPRDSYKVDVIEPSPTMLTEVVLVAKSSVSWAEPVRLEEESFVIDLRFLFGPSDGTFLISLPRTGSYEAELAKRSLFIRGFGVRTQNGGVMVRGRRHTQRA